MYNSILFILILITNVYCDTLQYTNTIERNDMLERASDYFNSYNKQKILNSNILDKDVEINENYIKFTDPNNKDLIGQKIFYDDAKDTYAQNEKVINYISDLQNSAFLDKAFNKEAGGILRNYNIERIGKNTQRYFGHAIRQGLSDEDFLKGFKEVNPHFNNEDYSKAIKIYHDFNTSHANTMARIENDRMLKNIDALKGAYDYYYNEFKHDSKTQQALRHPNKLFDDFKNLNKDQAKVVSAMIASFSPEQIQAMVSEQGYKGYNKFMDFLASGASNLNSTLSAITDAQDIFGILGSDEGNNIANNIKLHLALGLNKLMNDNPNRANIKNSNRVIRTDKDGKKYFTGVYKNSFSPELLKRLAATNEKLNDFITLKEQEAIDPFRKKEKGSIFNFFK